VNGDEIRDVRFLDGGYDAAQVDDLLRRISVELDEGRPAGPLIAGAAFRPAMITPQRAGVMFRRIGPRGYDTEAVDWFLDQLRGPENYSEPPEMGADPWRDLPVANHFTRSGLGGLAGRSAMPSWQARREQERQDRTYLARECADAWRGFGRQPGTCLRWAWAAPARCELRTMEAQTIASVRGNIGSMPTFFRPKTLRAGQRTFKFKKTAAAESSYPIAEIAARSAQDGGGRFAAKTMSSPAPETEAQRWARVRFPELVDAAGTPILYSTGANIYHRARARISFSAQRWLRFPVRGTGKANAIMTAVDQAGNKVARYRIIRRGLANWGNIVEITVHPGRKLTDELVLAIAVSAPWLGEYFTSPGGGGGG
jgi:DivIVA domain-containing protein